MESICWPRHTRMLSGRSAIDALSSSRCAAQEVVVHAATLHKPHIVTHTAQEFVDTNMTGTLNLLEEAVSAGVRVFVFTSTTSAFGSA